MRIICYPLLLLLTLPLSAQAEIYKYVDENGHVTFTDVYKKGSRRLDMPGEPIPIGKSGKATKRVSYAPSPMNFPRIDANTQRQRDDIRRQVLQEEINGERKNADDARRQLALGERLSPGEKASDASYQSRIKKLRATVQQHEQNVASIQRELANLK